MMLPLIPCLCMRIFLRLPMLIVTMHHQSGSLYLSCPGTSSFVHVLRLSFERFLVRGSTGHLYNVCQSKLLRSGDLDLKATYDLGWRGPWRCGLRPWL
jgi:hypothetical protein